MRRQLVNFSVGDVVRLNGKNLRIIHKDNSIDEENIPKEGISFDKNPELMHIIVEDVNDHAQQRLTGDVTVEILKGGK